MPPQASAGRSYLRRHGIFEDGRANKPLAGLRVLTKGTMGGD